MEIDIDFEKKELINRLEKIVNELTTKEKGLNVLMTNLKNTRSKIDSLISDCIDLQNEIITFSGEITELNLLKKKLIEYERLGHQLKTRLGFLPTFMLAYIGFAILFWITLSVDIPKFVVEKLGVEAPEKLISLGIAGAFLFLATEYLQKQEPSGQFNNKVSTFLIRLTLAVIVPIVLVILFFDKSGNIQEMSITPELLSFSCGYSAKLVIGIFSKIVEKGSKMIDAI